MPINGYFGAALWAMDVNNDGYDDLLVGAPFYSVPGETGDKTMEEGAVFVYLSSKTVTFISILYTTNNSFVKASPLFSILE